MKKIERIVWEALDEVFLKKKKPVKLLKPYPRSVAEYLKGGRNEKV